MRLAYFDCFAGAAGDMIVGALLDAGADFSAIEQAVGQLGIEGVTLSAKTVTRNGLAGTLFGVDTGDAPQPQRHLSDIVSLIDGASLPGRAGENAKAVFSRLAEAEAAVHQTDIESVHFHEVGAVDSIVDVVAACVAMEQLGVERVLCSPITVGSGTVTCAHGELPVPVPATSRLLVGVPAIARDIDGEATTPTAAAVLTTLAESFGPMGELEITAVGYGAGTREIGKLPNLLRVLLGRASDDATADAVVELSANIDDCTGEVIGATVERLLSAGALDAWTAPIYMKRSRPAWMLSAICRPADADEIARLILTETTTFGIRRCLRGRSMLQRRCQTVETPYGPVRVKVGALGGRDVTITPEFADCLAAAEAHHVPVKSVQLAARAAYAHANKDRPGG